ncbi:uncharacterized protein LOC113759472 [Coffea eugenioides]|uniref:uncharacterized protein LOC113759472 n=1 Tax=Coffea eugenioides TaxID=49369 RepID=UPI000F607816|nr:uncharacterized protein LOC113759472 [Coffea eugenioides]
MGFSHFRSKLPNFLSTTQKKLPTFNQNAAFFTEFRFLRHQQQQRLQIEKSIIMPVRKYSRFTSLSGLGLKNVKKSFRTGNNTTLVLLGSNGRRRMCYSSQASNDEEPSSPFREWLRIRMRSVGKCVVFVMIFGSLQVVPCSDRVHLVLSTDLLSKFFDRVKWENYQREYRGTILSPTSPEGVRVGKILGKILEGMYDGLGLQHDYHASIYSPEKIDCDHFSMAVQSDDGQKEISPQRRDGRFGIRYGTKHVEGMNWEVMLVDSDFHNAEYLSDGKIVFYTGVLTLAGSEEGRRMIKDADSFDAFIDAVIATSLSHEVGHGLAHHKAELFMRGLWLYVLLVSPFLRHVGILPIGLLWALIYSFLSRRDELEADHIGMMLMAAAGYDPRYAPMVRWWHSLYGSDEDAFSTHPSCERRAKILAQDEMVKQAMDVYKKVKAVTSADSSGSSLAGSLVFQLNDTNFKVFLNG